MKKLKVYPATQAMQDACAAAPKSEHYHLRLFVSGCTPKSLRAIQNLKAICEERLTGRYSMEVIDAYKHPADLEGEQILVTPTLIKKLPFPIRRIVGDLSDKERVLIALDAVVVPSN